MKKEIKDQLRKILRRTVTRKITVRDAYNVFINQSAAKIPDLVNLAPEYQAGGIIEFLIDYYIQTHNMVGDIIVTKPKITEVFIPAWLRIGRPKKA